MTQSTWVYVQSEPGLWTTGFYSPDGKWHSDTDWGSKEEAAQRVHYLNGGSNKKETINADLLEALKLLLSHPSDNPADAVKTDDGYFLSPLNIAEREARRLIREVEE